MSRHAKPDLLDLNDKFTAEFAAALQALDEVYAECRRVLDVVTGPYEGCEIEHDDEWDVPPMSDGAAEIVFGLKDGEQGTPEAN